MIDHTQGDPAIQLTENGATLVFKGGQPVMDAGLENVAQISILTGKGWAGNTLLPVESQIGSDFEERAANDPITLNSLASLEKILESSLDSDVFGTVTAEMNNPKSYQLEAAILIQPPGEEQQEIILTRNGQNWINQANDPAHGRY
jgi:hypothetical protein